MLRILEDCWHISVSSGNVLVRIFEAFWQFMIDRIMALLSLNDRKKRARIKSGIVLVSV